MPPISLPVPTLASLYLLSIALQPAHLPSSSSSFSPSSSPPPPTGSPPLHLPAPAMNPLSAPMMATRLSRSSAEQKVRVVQLYRQLLRQVPWIKTTHDLPHTHSQLRATVNSHFRRNIAITDPGVVDLLIFKGKTE